MFSIDTDGKRIFIAATFLSLVSVIVAIFSVCYYMFDQTNCNITTLSNGTLSPHNVTLPVISTALETSYSWVALITAAMLILMTFASTVDDCNNKTTSMVSSVLSTILLAGLCAIAGYIANEVEKGCPGDFHDEFLGTSIAVSASAGIACIMFIYLWSSNTGNIEASFGDLQPRYRRARQFV